MLQEYSAILLTFIKLPVVIKIFVLSFFEWPFYTGFTVPQLIVRWTCVSPQPARYDFSYLLSHPFIFLGSLYCKQNGHTSLFILLASMKNSSLECIFSGQRNGGIRISITS